MAILKGFNYKMKGSIGNFTFRVINGNLVVSEKITRKNDSRTPAQQRIRMKFANIIKMYKATYPLFACAFEGKEDNVSDYNMFMKLNINEQPVYLTKEEATGGACIVAPYAITQGSLSTISVSKTTAGGVSNINLGSLVIDDSTTIAEFAGAVVQNNHDFDYCDEITFVLIEQQINKATQLPCGVSRTYRVMLDKLNTSPLLCYVPAEGFSTIDGHLGHHTIADNNYAYAWVHTRKLSNKTLLSSQSLIDNNSLLTQYTSEEAYRRAVETYGGEHDKLL